MLWDQISINDRERISTEIKVNIGIISAGLKGQERDESLYSKLKVVSQYLRTNKLIGTINKPNTFFKGTIDMTWQETEDYSDERVVLFHGIDADSNKIIKLVGSASHIIGMNKLETASLVYGNPSFWAKIYNGLNTTSEKEIMDKLYDLECDLKNQSEEGIDDSKKPKLEFIAKTYISNEGFILGSPIYIAETN